MRTSMRSSLVAPLFFVAGIISLPLTVLALTTLSSWNSTDVDEIGLHYSGGPIEGRRFEALIPPSTSGTFYGPLDTVEKLPANQRTYTISKVAAESDTGRSDFIGAANSDGVEVEYETSTYFEINRKPDVVKEFYERVCTKYDGCQGKGWDMMLNDNLRKAQETTLQNVSRDFSTDDLRLDDGLLSIQREASEAMQKNVNNNLGGPYFTIRAFQINDTDVPGNVAAGYSQVKAEELKTQAQSEQVEQAKEQARAADQLREAAGDPSYLELQRIRAMEKAIEKGQIEFWVLPNDATITAPAR